MLGFCERKLFLKDLSLFLEDLPVIQKCSSQAENKPWYGRKSPIFHMKKVG